jgi:hypothetical protein
LRVACIILVIIQFHGISWAQKSSCKLKIDSIEAIRIAKLSGGILKGNEGILPSVTFDSTKCEWKIISQQFGHTKQGKCKYTNGCTISTTRTFVLNAETKKVKYKKTKIETFPNYE